MRVITTRRGSDRANGRLAAAIAERDEPARDDADDENASTARAVSASDRD